MSDILLNMTKAKLNIQHKLFSRYFNRNNWSAAKNKCLMTTSQIERWGTNNSVKSRTLNKCFSMKEIRLQMLELLSM